MVEKAKDYIRAGDIFQVVLSQRFDAPFALPPFALYRALRRVNPAGDARASLGAMPSPALEPSLSALPNPLARYFFAKPFPWAEEAMIMFMILGVFTGAIAVTWRNIHIRIDTFVERSSIPVQRIIRIAATLASMAVLFIVAWSSYGIVRLLFEYGQTTDALEFPMWIPQSFVTIGLVVIAILMFTRLVLTKARA